MVQRSFGVVSCVLATVLLTNLPGTLVAEEKVEDKSAESRADLVLQEVKVVGSKEAIKDMSGTAAYLDKEEIRTHSYDDVNRVLRKVPGVYVREEDGFGLFPNISLRGVDPNRSAKVTIMEDGVMMAPAPYSSPFAYYSPTIGRMSALEVLKGSSQIRYGPHSTGGVINYISTPIPDAHQSYVKGGFGRFNEIRTHAYTGNTFDTGAGRFGYLIENWQRSTEGFKTIDTNPPDFRNGDDTGFDKVEPMIKLMWEPPTSMYQRFEARFGYTNLDANETYLGQRTDDFRDDPFRRLAASRFDRIETEQFRSHIRHFWEIGRDTRLITTGYGTVFKRNWQKIQDCQPEGPGGSIVPEDLSQCLEDPEGNLLLKGRRAGGWVFRNNKRSYYTAGVESVVDHRLITGPLDHKIVAGARYHIDQVRWFQNTESFTQSANGALTNVDVSPPGSQLSMRERTRAIALHARDFISLGNFTISPGVRWERLNQTADFLPPTGGGDREGRIYSVLSGGGGLQYDVSEQINLFGGVWRGISTPTPFQAVIEGTEEEFSLAFEAGVRYTNPRLALGTEVAFFHTDIHNMLVRASQAAGGATESVGSIRNLGVEYQIQYDPGTHLQWPVQNPWYFNMTWSHARIRTPTASSNPDSLFAGATSGAEVPYVPEFQFNAGTGLVTDTWNINLDVYYSDEVFTTATNSASRINPITGLPDARIGRTDAFFIVDLSGGYQVHEYVRLFANLRNLTDQEYIASRHPVGPRPGMPFFVFGGAEVAVF